MGRYRLEISGLGLWLLARVAQASVAPLSRDHCAEYIVALTAASDAVIVRDDQSRRVADIRDPFDVALHAVQPMAAVSAEAPRSVARFQQEFELLAGRITQANLLGEVLEFADAWGMEPRDVLVVLAPYALYLPRRYPALAAAMGNRSEIERWSARLRIDAFRREHPLLEARFRFYEENANGLAVPELVAELHRRGHRSVTERQVYEQLSALYLHIDLQLHRPLTDIERAALGSPAHIESAHEALLEAHGRSVPAARIAVAFGMTEQRVAFFLHRSGRQFRFVPWDRTVVDADGRHWSETDFLCTLDSQQMSVAAIAQELNRAAARARGESHISPGSPEFRTGGSVMAKLSTLGRTRSRAMKTHDISLVGYGEVVVRGQLQLPGAIEFIRDRRAAGDFYSQIGDSLGLSESAIHRFATRYQDYGTENVPAGLRELVENRDGQRFRDRPSFASITQARNASRIVVFAKAHLDHEGGPRPQAVGRDRGRTAEEVPLANALNALKNAFSPDQLTELLRSLSDYRELEPAAKAAVDHMFLTKLQTLPQKLDRVVAFALANENSPLGMKPRYRTPRPRNDEELELGEMLDSMKESKNVERALLELEANPRYVAATIPQKEKLRALFTTKRYSAEQNIERVLAFAVAFRHDALGPSPRQRCRNPRREDEVELGKALGNLKSAANRENTLAVLQKNDRFSAATDADKAFFRSLFLPRRSN